MPPSTWYGAFSLLSIKDLSERSNIFVEKWLQRGFNGFVGRTQERTVVKLIASKEEIDVLRIVAHENITPLLASFTCSFGGHTAYVMVMPLYRCDLFNFIVGYVESRTAIAVEQTQRICRDIAKGLQHIHSKGWVHGDIKPENIFLTEDGKAVIGDFGGSSLEGMPITSATMAYAAPELIKTKNGFPACDVWSLAGLMYTMLCNKLLFSGNETDTLYLHVLALDFPSELMLKSWYFTKAPIDEFLRRRKYDGVENVLSRHPFALPIGDTPLHRLVYGCLKWEPSSRMKASEIVELLQ